MDELVMKWRERAASWDETARDGADGWIRERSAARAQAWRQAADELSEALLEEANRRPALVVPAPPAIRCRKRGE